MDLVFLDSDFNIIKSVEYINLQWNRRYYECGQYSIQILAEDFEETFYYVYRPSEKEVGIVQKIEYTSEERGEFVQISGFFMESMLNNYIMHPTFSYSGSLTNCIFHVITTFCTGLGPLRTNLEQVPSKKISIQATGDEVGDFLFSLLKENECSLTFTRNYVDKYFEFKVEKGLDRTADIAPILNVEPAIFNQTWGHFKNLKVVTDTSNYKNYAVVAGSGEGEQRKTVIVDKSNGTTLQQLYVDARDLQQKEGMSSQEYLDILSTRGAEKLSEHNKILNISFDLIGNLIYKENFDLGDKCDIILKNMGEYQSRIIGINETVKENRKDINVIFGDKVPRRK